MWPRSSGHYGCTRTLPQPISVPNDNFLRQADHGGEMPKLGSETSWLSILMQIQNWVEDVLASQGVVSSTVVIEKFSTVQILQ